MKGELITIIRTEKSGKQTLGEGLITNAAVEVIYKFKTLELPWKDNEQQVSCIPAGTYEIEKRYSQKYGWHLHVLDVPGREWILIHPGNYYTQIRGCILPGKEHVDINNDGQKDVVRSVQTMGQIMRLTPNRAHLKILER